MKMSWWIEAIGLAPALDRRPMIAASPHRRWQESDAVTDTPDKRGGFPYKERMTPPDEPDLDFALCERVRYARDPAYDGIIFIAVKSTGIYCRPVCPVRQPLS